MIVRFVITSYPVYHNIKFSGLSPIIRVRKQKQRPANAKLKSANACNSGFQVAHASARVHKKKNARSWAIYSLFFLFFLRPSFTGASLLKRDKNSYLAACPWPWIKSKVQRFWVRLAGRPGRLNPLCDVKHPSFLFRRPPRYYFVFCCFYFIFISV